ncbi:DUF2989 domain-containing protein [Shewanella sp. 1_MG-2023]|uniref:DUF2989 domain-containing protein n=1 Tax=Shewanella electrodiphila TaxID=934143 RepID=A0ABT0KU52_9GAMM|nr:MULTISPECIES: DUF2989 domain-containing protein [Shewanella]MCL1046880.1 DUF2989 domain-containing protein [Shewanella electrodiphila]MDO6612834.1 DUF2989 domain-containing protein [Shewanella sp. 7_MG-2023]MDO6772636.1 DUF2989 domain-containing protein [Shewanella sp. 2_MG-2023]MDO6795160.1 DUF2989 domain-containing protein [Shewanella sp. 1_MG-2023]
MSKSLVIITSFSIFAALFGLFGCDVGRNSGSICKNNPELCADLHRDSWCLVEKGDLIRSRYQLKITTEPTGKQLYDQLIKLESYSKCIELAAGVIHIQNTDRTLDRERAYAVSTQNLIQLREYTKDNPDNYLVYYRWTTFNDIPSRDTLIKAEKNGEITEPFILAQLASHYIKTDMNRAKMLYLHLLSHVKPKTIDPDWLLALATIYRWEQNVDNEYLLTKANTLMSDNIASQEKLLALIANDSNRAQQLDLEAIELVRLLKTAQFDTSEIKSKFE